MLTKVVLILTFYFLVAPSLTLIHELGHAIVPLVNGSNVQIEVGELKLFSLQLGQLQIYYGSFLKPWIGYTLWNDNARVIPLILGPCFSLTTGIILMVIYLSFITNPVIKKLIFAAIGWAIFQFLLTIVPMKYPTVLGYPEGTLSDGMKIIRSLSF